MIDIGLYIKLVTYARSYILTLVVPCCHVISYMSFIVCYWYWLFRYLLFSDYHVIAYIVFFIYTSTFLVTHTLIRLLLTTLNSHVLDFWMPSYIVSVFVWSYASRGVGVSLFLFIGILALLFMLFPWFSLYHVQLSFLSFTHLLSLC